MNDTRRPPAVVAAARLRASRLVAASASIGLAALLVAACQQAPSGPGQPLTTRAAGLDLDSVADRPVSGTLADVAFRAKEARIRVDRRPGRERVELWFSEERLPRCGLPGHDRGRRVWIRFDRRSILQPDTFRVERRQRGAPFTLHYETQRGRAWMGRSGGVAALRIDSLGELGDLTGRVRMCFDDGGPSCLAGRFHATPCTSRIDGAAVRELPDRGTPVRPRPESAQEDE